MAKQTAPKSAPKPAAAGGPEPYPKNWGTMKPEERQAWMRQHRPGRKVDAPIPAPAREALAPRAPAPEQSNEADADAAVEQYDQGHEQEPPADDHAGDIVIPGAALRNLDARGFLAKLLRSVADALEDDAPAEI